MESDEEELAPLSFSQYADEMCSFYMAIGVSYDDYWHGNYTMLPYYRDMHKKATEEANQKMWLQGLYNYKGFEAGIKMLLYALDKNRSRQPEGYPDKPIRITPLTDKEKAERAEAERQKIIADLTAWQAAWESKNDDR